MKITVQKVIKGVRYLKHYGVKEFFIRLQEKMESENVPYEPWYEHHKATEETLRRQRKQSAAWKGAPCVSIVVPLYCTNETFLREMIGSVQAQSYENWELCLADGSPEENAARLEAVVRKCAGEDTRICYRRLEKNLGIAGNTNAAIAMAHGEWIALLDHDDLLAPDALYETVHLILRGPKDETGVAATGFRKAGAQYDMIYTDEDKVDMDGKTHFQPHFKPDINIDLLRSNNYITHFTMMRKTLLEKAGMIREEYDGAQDYDLFLRCVECAEAIGHVPRVLYHWRCHTESTSENPFSKQYAVDAGRRALEDHLKRQGIAGEVTANELNTLEDDQKKFVSNVSHDFRSPLTSIKGYVEAMLDGTIPVEMQDKYLNIILFETERLNKLTKSLLELNKFGSHGTMLDITDFDINHTIRMTVQTFEGRCMEKRITFNLILTGEKLFVSADMSKIEQVLYNLIDNAIKFSHTDSAITIETTEKNDKIFVSVKDTGIGIPGDSIKKIWERFYKTDLSRGKDKKGTGLGLSIVKEIVQAHGENINCISTEGVGTEFIFTLPLAKKLSHQAGS